MMTRYEAWLNQKALSSVDPSIYILDIAYSTPRTAKNVIDITGRNGQRIVSRHALNNSVEITFEIHEHDPARRQEVCRKVQAWATGGGVLTTRDRRGQRLNVVCEEPPAIDSALKWTRPLKVTFTAYEQPLWEDEYPRGVKVDEAEIKRLYVPGIGAMTRVGVSVSNTSGGVVNAITLRAGGTTMAFEELNLASGETMVIGYDENGLLTIRVGDTSKMRCRTAESDDDLMIETGGSSDVSVSGASVSATFTARGLYL